MIDVQRTIVDSDAASGYAQVNIGSSRVSAQRFGQSWGFTVWTSVHTGSVADGDGFDSAEAALRVGLDALRLALENERRLKREWAEAHPDE